MTGPDTVLETERLRLTTWLPEQVEDVVLLHSDPEVTRYLTSDGQPEPQEKAERRLVAWAKEYAAHRMGKLRVVRKSDGVFVGRAGFGIYVTGEPELGYALLREHWRHGYALEAASGLRDWLFSETGFDHFIGFADVRNLASRRVLEKIGMTPTGERNEPNDMLSAFYIFKREDWHG